MRYRWLTAFGACLVFAARADIPPPDHVVLLWYAGMPVVSRSFEITEGPGYLREADIPETTWQQAISYVVGIADPAIGESPRQHIRLPDGREVVMPGHQAVKSCLGTPQAPILGVAYSVLPAPDADPLSVRWDEAPPGSIIGAPLATALRVGPSWLPLTNHRLIEYGLHAGLLKLRFFGANPTGWATPAWKDNYPFMPEMAQPCRAPARAQRDFLLPGEAPPMPAH